MERLKTDRIVQRVWDGDHTVWSPAPDEISDRLGWLTLPDTMRPMVRSIEGFASGLHYDGVRHVVLLGMGGSSLGPEALRRCYGPIDGAPEFFVLDSTVPAAVSAVSDTIDPIHTVFIVSSKSGSTIEPKVLYRYFRSLVEDAVGAENAGSRFVAITDAGTPLETLAGDEGFRRIFHNPEDVGGRYSVLSYFGLAPAAIAGIDVSSLLASARSMEEACEPHGAPECNPGLWLGAVIASLALAGRDKLTLVTSPSLEGFGLWLGQLIAESAGKDRKGIVPVIGEPLVDASHYGDDRAFVFLRLATEVSAELDAAESALKAEGHPVIAYTVGEPGDLGGEFYRWEFAVCIAAHVLGVHPFDQPDVQRAKRLTEEKLSKFQTTGEHPDNSPTGSLEALLDSALPGDYLAILAYLPETDSSNRVFGRLRRRIVERWRIATTLDYGPRYLHSTGQLHKAGPDSGLFLQVTADDPLDVPVPDSGFSLRTLARAQSAGDGEALTSLGRRFARVVLPSYDDLDSLG